MKFILLESSNNKNLYHAYHGTKKDFDKFSYEFLGEHGAEHGWGFYFTNRESIAQSYGDVVIEADLKIENPLSEDEITITKDQVKEFIYYYIDKKGNDYLSNYGDINTQSYKDILNEHVDTLFAIYDSDVEIISDIFNVNAEYDKEKAFKAINKVFNKDGIIYSGWDTIWGKPVTNYIVFDDDQILNRRKKKV